MYEIRYVFRHFLRCDGFLPVIESPKLQDPSPCVGKKSLQATGVKQSVDRIPSKRRRSVTDEVEPFPSAKKPRVVKSAESTSSACELGRIWLRSREVLTQVRSSLSTYTGFFCMLTVAAIAYSTTLNTDFYSVARFGFT